MANSTTHGPNYYKRGSIEPWDFIRDQGLSYHLGNAIKYICRAGYKESIEKDLKKAIHYLQNEIDNLPSGRHVRMESKKFPNRVQPIRRIDDYLVESSADFDR
jgi:hypothetical protein